MFDVFANRSLEVTALETVLATAGNQSVWVYARRVDVGCDGAACSLWGHETEGAAWELLSPPEGQNVTSPGGLQSARVTNPRYDNNGRRSARFCCLC